MRARHKPSASPEKTLPTKEITGNLQSATRDFLVKWPDGAEDSWVRARYKPSASFEKLSQQKK